MIRVFVLLFVFAGAFAFAEDSKVQAGWEFWTQGDRAQARVMFEDAKQTSEKERAHLSLMFLNQLEERGFDAREELLSLRESNKDFGALVSALELNEATTYFAEIDDIEEDVMYKYYREVIANPQQYEGVVKAEAIGNVASILRQIGELEEAIELWNTLGVVDTWSVIGPFENISASGHDRQFAPEREYDVQATYQGKGKYPAKWLVDPVLRIDRWLDFFQFYPFGTATYYANTFVHSESNQTVYLRLGVSGSYKVFLNDQLVADDFEERDNGADTYVIKMDVAKGWNRLLFKISGSETGGINMMARITDKSGNQLPNLKYSNALQQYPNNHVANASTSVNAVESAIQQLYEANKDKPEYGLLYTYLLLKEDKAEEADIVLAHLEEMFPKNSAFISAQMEANARSGQSEDNTTLLESLRDIDPDLPAILIYEIELALESKNVDEAEEFFRKYEKLYQHSGTVTTLRLQMYAVKDQYDRMLELIKDEYDENPKSVYWASLYARVIYEETKNPRKLIGVYEDLVDDNFLADPLETLAGMYLNNDNFSDWKEIMEQLVAMYPSETYYIDEMADVYTSMREFDEAEKLYKKALEICPGCTGYLSDLGDMYELDDKSDKALEVYKEALNRVPTMYQLRDKIRKLEEKAPVFEVFAKVDVDSLIEHVSRTQEDYPDNDVVLLLDETRRVVYPGGTSEYIVERVYQVLNKDGVDNIKEYSAWYNGYRENLTIEQAKVHKQNGVEIDADESGNSVVFKELEVGDYAYIRYRVRSYSRGRLAGHFWDECYFSSSTPTELIRYSMYTPKDFDFSYNLHNSDMKPVVTDLGSHEMYVWEMKNLEGLKWEYSMPRSLADVGIVLYISSVPDWEYMVDWYADLTASKHRSSHEVRKTVASIIEDPSKLTREEKIHAVYNFITENIRYSSVSFRQSGLIPQKSRDVLKTKIGDCKDVSTLFITMLRELDIEAYYVLINTRDNGKNAGALPNIGFNHCIAAVEDDRGEMQYYDLTAEHHVPGTLPTSDLGGFSLLIKDGKGKPFYMPREPFIPSTISRQSDVIVNEDQSISVTTKSLKTGNVSASMMYYYKEKGEQDRLRDMTETLAGDFPNVSMKSFVLGEHNKSTSELEYEYSFEVPDYLSNAGSIMMLKLPWSDPFEADRALSYDVRQFDYLYWPYADTLTQELSITLPAGYQPLELSEPIVYSNDVADYSMKLTFKDGKLFATRRLINKKYEVTTDQYAEFKEFYNKCLKADEQQVLLQKK